MLNVLLVEDQLSDVLLVREAMRRSPIAADVDIAYDGEQALKLLEQPSFDLVMLDLNIPKCNGHTILEKCMGRSGPPIVVFTGSQNPADMERALALGAV